MNADEKALRESIAKQIEDEILPNGRISKCYDCCGCSTYELIADDCISIVRGE